MGGCFTGLLAIAALVLVITSMIRWFEQVTEAVDNRWWNKLFVLTVMPPAVWFFPSRVVAGRPTPVPHHEPVRGMGTAPKVRSEPPAPVADVSMPAPASTQDDGPPPGTPKQFLGMPVIPPKKPRSAPAVDPEKLAKLKEKMRQQGMLNDDDKVG